ncbi:lysozyme inhibitor LprI family protein [Aestuariibius sp. 2305UL40-4]|uniref:lysozyme inhibitor LprI family protein n=1 Tax=Aestuariibius violaceus TaxID=3234132 RepID=UPI00345EFEC9
MRAVFLLAILASPLAAEDIVFDGMIAMRCWEGSGVDCAGLAARRCIEESPEGLGTALYSLCFYREAEIWEKQVEIEMAALTEQASEDDTANAEYYDTSTLPGSQVLALEEMQAAWEGFRGARCDAVAAEWAGGTGRQPARAECIMRMTAQQALYLARMPENRIAQ